MKKALILIIIFALLLPCLAGCTAKDELKYPWEDPALSEEDAAIRYVSDRIIMARHGISAKQMTTYYDITVSQNYTGNTVVYYALTLFGYTTDEAYTVTLNSDLDPLSIEGDFGEYACFFPIIKEADIKKAEEKLDKQAEQYDDASMYFLNIDEDGYLCLCVEFINNIDPPNVDENGNSKGCGLDHEHIFVEERICKKP